MKFRRIEESAVFRTLYLEAVLFSEFGDHGLDDAEVAVGAFHYLVFKARGFGEDEQRFGRREGKRLRQGDRGASERCRFQEVATICGIIHNVLLECGLSGMSFGMWASWKRRKNSIGRPAQFAHADFGRVVGAGNPILEVIELFVVRGI